MRAGNVRIKSPRAPWWMISKFFFAMISEIDK
jgi:hypothetical protein